MGYIEWQLITSIDHLLGSAITLASYPVSIMWAEIMVKFLHMH